MKKLIVQTFLFIVISIIVFVAPLFLPSSPWVKASFLSTEIQKDSLLVNEPSPRIILVGGSNLPFGINSQLLKDSLKLYPVNTGINANLGIKYMLDNTLQYVKDGDIIIVAPEYQHFYGDWDHGSWDLLQIVWEINKSKIRLLNWKQMIHCAQYLGNMIHIKITTKQYYVGRIPVEDRASAINQYGDADAHWNLKSKKFPPYKQLHIPDYNPKVLEKVLKISREMKEKGAKVFVTYPGYQNISFDISKEAIKKVEAEYFANGFSVLGTPERYRMSDSLMFDTPYHLIKEGVDRRTQLLIEDIKHALAPQLSVQASTGEDGQDLPRHTTDREP